MSTKKDNKNKKSNTKHNENTQKIKSALNGETGHFIGGLICLMFGVYLFLAFTSFLSAGDADQSAMAVNSVGETEIVKNHTGPAGARLAEFLINGCFGIPAYFIVIVLLIAGTKLMKAYNFTVWKWFLACMSIMYWMSVTLGFIFGDVDSFIYPGGLHGYNVSVWIQSYIGMPGLILLLIFCGIIIGVAIRRQTMEVVRKILHPNFRKNSIEEKADDVQNMPETAAATEPAPVIEESEEEVSDDESAEDETAGEKKKSKWYERLMPGGILGRLFGRKHDKDDVESDDNENEEEGEDAEKEETEQVRHNHDDSFYAEFKKENEPETYAEEVYSDDVNYTGNSIELPLDDAPVNARRIIEAEATAHTEPKTGEPEFEIEERKEEETVRGDLNVPYNPRLDLELYKFPTLDLLKTYPDDGPSIDMEEQTANKNRIIQVLRSFGIEISSIKANVGPTVTLYEITPAEGVRISKIRNLEDDIALSLSALGIRIIAPIPGKGTIGIEVPNASPKIVPMSSVLASKKFQESTYELPIALGKTITNEVFMVDLAKAPHMLVAGATGQGKSVGLNAIVTSLLYKKHPSELKFVIIDPKKVEFAIYAPIEKHFLAKLPDAEDAIITDVTKVVQTLNSLCVEMDTRYDLLKKAGCRNIKEYNAKFINRQLNPANGHKFMPYIVIIIDEFGDLIMTAGKEVELPICRIAQLARAVGIHAIIATQRPTTNIITGTIKANFPARVAFRVASMMDSRTILDRPGAQQLIGKGDMLYLQGNDPVRVQCAFVDTPEVERISEYISKQQGYPTAFELPEYVDENAEPSGAADVDMNRLDPMFEEAARLIIYHQQGSTSLIQRKLSLGYNRAGRIMDQLERAGIVGPANGSKARDVLCIDENDLQMRLSQLKVNN
ncbi:DNA translocase FtsK 4TM domain-containing protein [Bacteroides caecigallinarum]|uniref:DNA translocase FtsK 4TM domain-containing protein n=1 Tax=Bacteroides caecigallinarum TaxID=1411144 RepID=UPI00195A7322|nr:DNA translocase FtsK 4TM domain-containing protein [Bacteroides caecigallinarum]